MNPVYRLGVVGAGYWGPNLIRTCAELGVLHGVCDIDPVALASTKKLYPHIVTATDFVAFLHEPIDAVIIAAPAQLHLPMALAALKAGKHVFVEKPLALNAAEGTQMVEAAQASGLGLFVGHLLLYHPAVRKLSEAIAEGAVGQVRHIRSRRLSMGKLRSHENVWWSFAPHDVALMLHIMGGEPHAAVSSQTTLHGGDLCDVTYADFSFSDARSAHIEVCWLDPEKTARLDVFGTKGILTFADSRQSSTLTLTPFEIAQDGDGRRSVSRGETRSLAFEWTEPLKAELHAFLAFLKNKASSTDGRHGLAVLRALELAEASHKQSLPMNAYA